jgi:molecular chaperone IbpA
MLHNYQNYDRFFIGSDLLLKQFADLANTAAKTTANYPPYNIKKVDDNKYVIEMAVAGFAKQDIELEMVDGTLKIKGNIESLDDKEKNYLHKGISDKAFTRSFSLADNVEIKGADLFNGMLKVWLEAIIPEHKKPKKIEINEQKK